MIYKLYYRLSLIIALCVCAGFVLHIPHVGTILMIVLGLLILVALIGLYSFITKVNGKYENALSE